MAKPVCFRHITKESFLLQHSSPQDFVLTWWNDNVLVYAVWSTFCTIYCLAMVLYSGLNSEHGIKIFIWLTYWTFYCLTLRFTVTAINCWHYTLRQPGDTHGEMVKQSGTNNDDVESACMHCCTIDDRDSHSKGVQASRQESQDSIYPLAEEGYCPKKFCLQWMLQNITNVCSIMVTIMFWALVYSGNPQTYVSINSHVMNSVLVLVDIMISRAPFRLQHIYIPFVFVVSYVIFTCFYWIAGGTNHQGELYIYKLLDYSKHPGKAAGAIIMVCFIALPMVQLLVLGLFQIRNILHRHFVAKKITAQNEMKVIHYKESS